ncbi:Hypothetical predicted protein [Prunus dulcis]|nr:Hypothetical predicted protein [Prunus dulcis]
MFGLIVVGLTTLQDLLLDAWTPYQKIGGLWYQTKNVAIGYWPKELVPSLEIEAGDVGWGGIAMAQEKENAPPLGSGQYPDGTSLESQGDTKEVFVGSVSRSSEVFSREKFRRLGEVVSRSTHLVFMEDDEELGLLLGFAAPISRSCTASFAVRERGLHSEFLKASIVVELEEGDIIDCVDIYKQPAFDNPLLKNHKIQLRPTSFPAQMKNSAPVTDPISETWSKREASPDGTVPIHRTTKDDLDTQTSNWWLAVTDRNITVGYWPKEMLPHLRNGAGEVGWGGTAMAATKRSPPIGSGQYPDDNYDHAAYFRNLHFMRGWLIIFLCLSEEEG